jgi:hypothetical protein
MNGVEKSAAQTPSQTPSQISAKSPRGRIWIAPERRWALTVVDGVQKKNFWRFAVSRTRDIRGCLQSGYEWFGTLATGGNWCLFKVQKVSSWVLFWSHPLGSAGSDWVRMGSGRDQGWNVRCEMQDVKCKMQNEECGMGNRHWQVTTCSSKAGCKRAGSLVRAGRHGPPYIPWRCARGASGAQQRAAQNAGSRCGGVICKNGNSVVRATPARNSQNGSVGGLRS